MDKTIWQESDSDRLIHQLYQTMRLFSKTLNQEIADTGIYSSEWTILNLIHHREDCAQTALSQYLGVEPAAISKTLTKMEKKGLIRRVTHPSTRGKFIELTEKGAQAHRDLSSAVAEHRRKALQGLSPEILQGLNDVMLRIQRNLSSGE